jgi:hypothetical protein
MLSLAEANNIEIIDATSQTTFDRINIENIITFKDDKIVDILASQK